jgi:hypothetical protein
MTTRPTQRPPDAGGFGGKLGFIYAVGWFCFDGFAVPAPAQVTQTKPLCGRSARRIIMAIKATLHNAYMGIGKAFENMKNENAMLKARIIELEAQLTAKQSVQADLTDSFCYNGNHESKNGICVVDGDIKPSSR